MRFSEARHTLLKALNEKQEAEVGLKTLHLAMEKVSNRVDKYTVQVSEKEAEHSAARNELFQAVRSFMSASRKLRNAKTAEQKGAQATLERLEKSEAELDSKKLQASQRVEAAKAKKAETEEQLQESKENLEKYKRMQELANSQNQTDLEKCWAMNIDMQRSVPIQPKKLTVSLFTISEQILLKS